MLQKYFRMKMKREYLLQNFQIIVNLKSLRENFLAIIRYLRIFLVDFYKYITFFFCFIFINADITPNRIRAVKDIHNIIIFLNLNKDHLILFHTITNILKDIDVLKKHKLV